MTHAVSAISTHRHPQPGAPVRLLMTVDAVGGVWRYAMGLARALAPDGVSIVFAGLGPGPTAEQRAEAQVLGELVWLDAPLDWTCKRETELEVLPELLRHLAVEYRIDLIHLNLPSQSCGLEVDVPILVVSHSCIPTWWRTMRGEPLPDEWQWHMRRNKSGFERADAIVAPSRSHAKSLENCYGALPRLTVVPNALAVAPEPGPKEEFVFAAARWWDESKNGKIFDIAAQQTSWPLLMAGPLSAPDGQHFMPKHAYYCGELSNREVLEHMRRAAVVVSPSLYEPFGLVALEAAHADCALVLSDIPTYRELWPDAAFFFDPHDAASLVAALDHLVADRALQRDLAMRASQRARHFTPRAQAEAMSGIYRSMIAASRRHSAAGA
ncbi:glycosyltransferase family 4 protein [Chelativorans xinjiangense]|uniref:glycosyltransferase family 4 protein n=1 Tax=Chelativorans xinjiangense TaxID=2681485 RepID=UPI001FE5190C|nr:glycosyltransferase family 4 protein [Chelativorans xinjiangense]